MITPEKLLSLTNKNEVVQPYKLGVIDPDYIDGKARIIFDGENIASEKEYPRLASYKPVAGDRVILAKLAGTYVILGKVI